jgi:hypothetical protein
MQMLAEPEKKLQKSMRSFKTTDELIEAIPDARGRGLGKVDVKICAQKLSDIDHMIHPHGKIACIDEAHSLLNKCVAEACEAQAPGRPRRDSFEITGDDVLSLFILAIHKSNLPNCLAHIAHVEMYSQGEAARLHESGYAVTALQSALKFFLEERRHPANTAPRSGVGMGPGSPRESAISRFMSYGHETSGSIGGDDDLHQALNRAAMGQGRR